MNMRLPEGPDAAPPGRQVKRRAVAVPVMIAALALFWLDSRSAHAQSKLAAHYVLSLASITIGGGDWNVEIGKDRYTAKSDGQLLATGCS